MNSTERLMNEVAALIEQSPNMIVIRKFPKWNEEVFAGLTSSLSPAIRQSAAYIIRGHMKDQSQGRQCIWMGARPPLDPKAWNANHLVTVYYLSCQPSA